MNFFQQQERAKNNTTLFIFIFFIAVCAVVFSITYISSIIFFAQTGEFSLLPTKVFANMQTNDILLVALGTILFILNCSLYKIEQFSSGGVKVAQSLGGKLVSKSSKNTKEIVLINVVEEIAIASGIPVPDVYIIEDNSINAFAAGFAYDDAIIGVTRGAINLLSRDELQGVIAHEFSHIFNGDMKLNIRAVGILHGILCISLLGKVLLEIALRSGGSSRSSKNSNGNATLIIMALGISMYIIGLIGLFFGNIVKAAINRQREYLADASAIQFTRLPSGLAGALKKIGSYSSKLKVQNASEISHFYFSKGVSGFFSFDTHPPLEKRIRAIEPNWDGVFENTNKKDTNNKIVKNNNDTKVVKTLSAMTILNKLDKMNFLSEVKVQNTRNNIEKLPKEIYKLFENSFDTQLLIFSMLLKEDGSSKQIKEIFVSLLHEEIFDDIKINEFKKISQSLKDVSKERYFDLINLSISPLKQMSSRQYETFKEILNKIVLLDKKVSLFEINIKYLVLYPLDIYFEFKQIPKEHYKIIKEIEFEVSVLLSFLSFEQTNNEEKAKDIFNITKQKTKNIFLNYIENDKISSERVEKSFDTIQNSSPVLKHKLLEIFLICFSVDGEVISDDFVTIHAIASLLHLPLTFD